MRGNVAVHDNVRTILDAEILVCGTADAHSVGAATTNGRVTKFEPIQFEDPKHVEQFESIQCFPATGNHYVILATLFNGTTELYGVGYCGNGHMGKQAIDLKKFTLLQTPPDLKITQVASGFNFTAFLTQDNTIYYSDSQSHDFVRLDISTSRIVQMKPSFYNLYLLTQDSEVFEYHRGRDKKLQLISDDVDQMQIGGYHFQLLKTDGEWYQWACQGAFTRKLHIPNESIIQVKCGWWTTYVVTARQKIYRYNSDGLLDTPVATHQNLHVVKSINVVVDDLHVLSTDNRLFGYGGNSYRVLGIDSDCSTMKEIVVDRPGDSQIIEIYSSYVGSYLLLGKPSEHMNVYKILKRGGFVDIDIKLG